MDISSRVPSELKIEDIAVIDSRMIEVIGISLDIISPDICVVNASHGISQDKANANRLME